MAAPLALGSIADLIVSLRIAEKTMTGKSARRSAMAPAAKSRMASIVDKRASKSFGQISDGTKVGVVAKPLAGKNGVQGVVKIVAPLGRNAVTTDFPRPRDTRVVEIAFSDECQVATRLRLELLNFSSEFFENMHRRGIEDGVHGVDA